MIVPGQTIAERYTVKNRIGRGGFATVFLAHDLNFERDVALKTISAEDSDNQEAFFAAFVQEARLIARLLHPNILDVYDYGRIGSEGYLAMPFANDGTLATKLRQRGPLPLGEAVTYFRQMATGLTYAHQRNIIHRDIKPQNMLLFKDGRLVISDFGLAKVLAETNGMTNTRVTGTPLYMAPEQWVGQAGKPTDVYALGMILYQMLTGFPPFQGANQSQLFFQHTNQPIPQLSATRPDLPPSLQLYLEDMTAKDPSARPPASNLMQLLDQAMNVPTSLLPAEQARSYTNLRDHLRQRQTEGDATLSYMEENAASRTDLNTPTELLDPAARLNNPSTVITPGRDQLHLNDTLTDGPLIRLKPAIKPVRPKIQLRWLFLLMGVIGLVVVGGIVALLVLRSDPNSSTNYPDASDVIYPTPLAPGAASVGTKVYSFTPPEFSRVGFDESGQFLKVDFGTGPVRKVNYRNLVKGNFNTDREKLPPDAVFSPDRKHAAVFTSYTANIRTVAPSPTSASSTPTVAANSPDIGTLTLYRTDTYQSVLKVDKVEQATSVYEPGTLAFSPDSKLLAFTYRGDAIGFIDLTNEKLLSETLAGEDPGTGKVLQSDFNIIFSGSLDRPFSSDGRFLRVVDATNPYTDTFTPSYVYDLHPVLTGGSLLGARPVLTTTVGLTYSPDSKHAVKRSDRDDSNFALFSIDNTTFTRVASLVGAYKDNVPPGQPGHVVFYMPTFIDNDHILAVSRNPDSASPDITSTFFATYSAQNGSLIGRFQVASHTLHAKDYHYIISIPDNIMVTGKAADPKATATLTFFDPFTDKQLGTIPGIHGVLDVSYDNKYLITYTVDGYIDIYNTTTYAKVTRLDQQFQMQDDGRLDVRVALSSLGPFLVTTDNDNHSVLWRLE